MDLIIHRSMLEVIQDQKRLETMTEKAFSFKYTRLICENKSMVAQRLKPYSLAFFSRRNNQNDDPDLTQSVLPVFPGLVLLGVTLFPALGGHVLGLFNLVDQVVVEVDVLDGVAPNEHLLHTVKSGGFLLLGSATLSLRIDVSILMFMNLSTPLMMPL